ncbi:molybdopterin-dependent oxidoreductase [Sphingomonas sp. KRR8]|uniref:molybdopterin cofactor-binding domain-containing protein n=1 Tax=Sphingomonas sp. KRR8 TaxID=2942996 RepID=UPI002021E7BB|nr:molybdopterin cofactor-binding domain-containing protein [Sphingomonas sp. KRR8]URD60498.1 molybdopterin-dependent oxidoreductase [Sphingomonas sp. KRR8]
MKVDRRTLLIGGGAGVGLVVAWGVWPRRYAPGLPLAKGEQAFDHFLKIAPSGLVTVAVPQVEHGQGVWTALPQLLADELGADWNKVAVIPSPAGKAYDNVLAGPLGKGRVTGGATSVRAFGDRLRQAGAAARAMLCAAAARRWGVSAAECDTAAGFVACGGRRLSFGDLAEAAAEEVVPRDAPLRARPAGLAMQPLPRLDGPPKVDGSVRFAADIRLPGLVHAAALIGDTAERDISGLHLGEGWVAAIGATSWAARQALARAAPAFRTTRLDDRAIELAMAAALEGEELPPLTGRTVTADYRMAAVPHLALEPPTATARWNEGRLELWAGTHRPDETLASSGPGPGSHLFPLPVGGPDHRLMTNEAAPIAAELARRLSRPVQVTLSPAHARAIDPVLAPAQARFRAKLGPDNRVLAWVGRLVGISPIPMPYTVPQVDIHLIDPKLSRLRTGHLRGGDDLFATFARESFVDELARQTGFEPLAFRIAMLGGHPRLARVLTTASALGGWDGGGAGSTLGLAVHSAYGSHAALLASATIGGDGQVAVDRLVCAVDCGRVVNPQLVRQQVESAIIAGLAYARAPAPSVSDGLLRSGGGTAPGLAGTPRITVEVIPSDAKAGGLSGLAVPLVAPAVANAVSAASGRRLRAHPFDPMSQP